MIDRSELLFVVDEEDNPLSPLPRHEVHEKGLWHRTSIIWVANNKGQILCQKRSMQKDTKPGVWEAYFGGHLAPGETYESCAVKEVDEELGISISSSDLHMFMIHKCGTDKEFQAIFVLRWDGDDSQLTKEKAEVEKIEWLSLETLKDNLLTKPKPDWSHHEYQWHMLDFLSNGN